MVILMNDNDLIKLFRPIIRDGLLAQNYPNVKILQSNQPTQQGVTTTPTLYFFKVMDHLRGSPQRKDVYDSSIQAMRHTDVQVYETTFQISALVTQDPADTNQITASDLVNVVAAILQSDYAIAQLLTQNVQILKIMDVRNPYFVDDRDRFESFASFDFILTYERNLRSTTPIVQKIEPGIFPV